MSSSSVRGASKRRASRRWFPQLGPFAAFVANPDVAVQVQFLLDRGGCARNGNPQGHPQATPFGAKVGHEVRRRPIAVGAMGSRLDFPFGRYMACERGG